MILIDTHILIWLALAPNKLSANAQQAITQTGLLLLADISLWEVAMLVQKRRVQIGTDSESFLKLMIQAYNVQIRSITPQIAKTAVTLPNSINKDPADRLIVATALAKNIPLVTADQNLQATNLITIVW